MGKQNKTAIIYRTIIISVIVILFAGCSAIPSVESFDTKRSEATNILRLAAIFDHQSDFVYNQGYIDRYFNEGETEQEHFTRSYSSVARRLEVKKLSDGADLATDVIVLASLSQGFWSSFLSRGEPQEHEVPFSVWFPKDASRMGGFAELVTAYQEEVCGPILSAYENLFLNDNAFKDYEFVEMKDKKSGLSYIYNGRGANNLFTDDERRLRCNTFVASEVSDADAPIEVKGTSDSYYVVRAEVSGTVIPSEKIIQLLPDNFYMYYELPFASFTAPYVANKKRAIFFVRRN